MARLDLPPSPSWDPHTDPLAVAIVAEAAERGYSEITVQDVVRRAGCSVEEFHRRFRDLDDCALQTYEAHIVLFKRRAGGAFNSRDNWRDALRAAAYETADWMEENPRLVRFGMTEVLKMKSEMGRVRREETFLFSALMIDAGRACAPDPSKVPDGAPMVAVGSILQLLSHRLQAREPIRPHAIVPEMMFVVVRTYLGEDAAREELARPPLGPA